MEVTLLLSDTLATAISSARRTDADRSLRAALEAWGVSMRRLAPGAHDPLGRYFVVHVPDASTAEQVRQELAALPGVEAAYIKPLDALP